eukprot:SAG31_NODE_31551_length_367_cov_0.455224_1_plen_42_part_10
MQFLSKPVDFMSARNTTTGLTNDRKEYVDVHAPERDTLLSEN